MSGYDKGQAIGAVLGAVKELNEAVKTAEEGGWSVGLCARGVDYGSAPLTVMVQYVEQLPERPKE